MLIKPVIGRLSSCLHEGAITGISSALLMNPPVGGWRWGRAFVKSFIQSNKFIS